MLPDLAMTASDLPDNIAFDLGNRHGNAVWRVRGPWSRQTLGMAAVQPTKSQRWRDSQTRETNGKAIDAVEPEETELSDCFYGSPGCGEDVRASP